MFRKFEPIAGKCGEIVDFIMSSPFLPDDEGLLFKIRLSAEEAVENIVSYAYSRGDGWIEVGTELKDGIFTLVLKDAGIPFDPLSKPDPDVTAKAEDRPIGGLGIFLCKKMMDTVSYEYKDGTNIFTMTKAI